MKFHVELFKILINKLFIRRMNMNHTDNSVTAESEFSNFVLLSLTVIIFVVNAHRCSKLLYQTRLNSSWMKIRKPLSDVSGSDRVSKGFSLPHSRLAYIPTFNNNLTRLPPRDSTLDGRWTCKSFGNVRLPWKHL